MKIRDNTLCLRKRSSMDNRKNKAPKKNENGFLRDYVKKISLQNIQRKVKKFMVDFNLLYI